MEKHARALDVSQEAVTDARALGSALDQSRNVGNHELAPLVANDSELRAERREGIVADLRRGVADRVQEGRLACVRQAEEADVGEQFKAEPDPRLFTRLASLVLARRAVSRTLIAGVAAAAETALEEDNALADPCEVSE